MRSANEPPPDRSGNDEEAAAARSAMDLLGQRWSLRIVWELEAGQMGFLELRRRMDNCSSSMLAERLRQLQDAGIVEKNAKRAYELSFAGIRLSQALEPLWDWSRVWAAGEQFDPFPPGAQQ
ncbi:MULTISPECIES: helix-turn-helix domain-containing protein [unclassified Rhodococcus (in: high G+C Gram-positive bacteria)]|uniref:winged helix-turn-helix transcriptional regulator n=1 Tax=unclassified Rhodococcus (in: high G+C Gram-positive bacteria) TaxID=192944 RepID=UPI00211A9759|nr:helix-turn-helix domain-containing protein [Rhodococcus sp. 1163]